MASTLFRPAITRTLVLVLVCASGAASATRDTRQTAAVTISGTLRLDTGEPLVGARISLAETGSALFSALVTTGADGRFSSSAVPGTYSITPFVGSIGTSSTDLVANAIFGLNVTSDVAVDLVARHGTVVQACIVGPDGAPLPGSTATVFSAERASRTTAVADASGWIRVVMDEDECLFVVPPPASAGREIARWLRTSEIARDPDGAALPIVLDALPVPSPISTDVTQLYRGNASGRHLTITFVSEGYTDGDEPFQDRNGNGICDDEPYLDVNGNGKYTNGEPFVDTNGDGKHTSEPFTDANGDGVCNRGERALFVRNADDVLRVLLGYPVYREMIDRIDVFAAFVPSAQAGSDFVSVPQPIDRDTAFGSKFQSLNFIFNIDRAAAVAAASRLVPSTDTAGVITYSIYGLGRESGGEISSLFATRVPKLDSIAAHEFGHTIGHLADEYFDYGVPPYVGTEPNYQNVTKTPELTNLKWGRFVPSGTAIPTADGAHVVGAFEGAYYHRVGVYRPFFNCLMRNLGLFCPVCAETMFGQVSALTGVARPSVPTLTSPVDGESTSTYVLAAFAIDDYARVASAQAIVDGAPVGDATTIPPFSTTVDVRRLSPGSHTIAIDVTLTSGVHVLTDATSVDVTTAAVSTPMLGTPRYAGGTITLDASSGVIVPGAVLFVNGTDRFALERVGDSTVRTVKRDFGSASNLPIKKVLRPRTTATLRVVNPDGGASETVTVQR